MLTKGVQIELIPHRLVILQQTKKKDVEGLFDSSSLVIFVESTATKYDGLVPLSIVFLDVSYMTTSELLNMPKSPLFMILCCNKVTTLL